MNSMTQRRARRPIALVGAAALVLGVTATACGDDVVDDDVEEQIDDGIDDIQSGVEDVVSEVEDELDDDTGG